MPMESSRRDAVVVAALQMTSGPDVGENLDRAVALLRAARARGATVAGLPENFSFMGKETDKPGIAEAVDGPTLARVREVARELGMAIVAGTIPETVDGDPARVRNTSVLVGADGEIAAVYRKIHLFDVELDEAQSFRESGFILRGDEVVAASAGGLKHGLTVCYDLRFPELYRTLDEKGAELMWVPSAFTLATGKDHWELLLRARAVENGCYVAAPAQFGVHSPRRVTYGNAMIVDPWGKVLARAPDTADTMAVAEVDLAYRAEVRRAMPTWRHHVL
jgi:deaminated glutathione amidase